jgi:putative nucleotidyltransferase with HDIG domain
LARTLAARDIATFEHARRVRRYARALASRVGILDQEAVRTLETAALFHDVGKLAIPDRVLSKAGPLTPDEYEQVKRHAAIGADLLTGLAFPGPLALLVRHHHENWDGSGYPDRLRREDIPAGARALSIADCYDALTSDRPYRRALSHAAAMEMMTDRCGSMFDPMMIEAFVSIARSFQPAEMFLASAARSVHAEIPSAFESGVR